MKHLFTFLLLAISTISFAQGNLQFNQVINNSIDATVSTNLVVAGTLTVPAGKVWKLESVSNSIFPGTSYSNTSTSNSSRVFIGNHIVWSNQTVVTFPIWFSEGTYSITIGDYHTPPEVHRFTYSAIEFNVVP